MEYPKFILTADGVVRLDRVTLHRHLLEPGDYCLGGGFYEFDYQRGELVLSGSSSDYGPPQWAMVSDIALPQAYYGLTVLYRSGTVYYYLADHHTIHYY